MSIEAIFRGKCEDTNEWVYGYYTFYGRSRGVHPAIITGTDKGCVIPKFIDNKTRGMFTGLTDINGKMIFEGDIIRAVHCREELNVSFVEFESGVYWCRLISGHFIDLCETLPEQHDECALEVIGNIYENPELLIGGID